MICTGYPIVIRLILLVQYLQWFNGYLDFNLCRLLFGCYLDWKYFLSSSYLSLFSLFSFGLCFYERRHGQTYLASPKSFWQLTASPPSSGTLTWSILASSRTLQLYRSCISKRSCACDSHHQWEPLRRQGFLSLWLSVDLDSKQFWQRQVFTLPFNFFD